MINDYFMILIAPADQGKERNWRWIYCICNFFKTRDSKANETCKNFIKLNPGIAIVYCIIVHTCIYVCNLSQ